MRLFFLGGEIMNDTLKEHLKLLPDKPGCYLMKDKNGKIIYVGKAKILKNRVRSYFRGAHNLKTTKLVSEMQILIILLQNPRWSHWFWK